MAKLPPSAAGSVGERDVEDEPDLIFELLLLAHYHAAIHPEVTNGAIVIGQRFFYHTADIVERRRALVEFILVGDHDILEKSGRAARTGNHHASVGGTFARHTVLTGMIAEIDVHLSTAHQIDYLGAIHIRHSHKIDVGHAGYYLFRESETLLGIIKHNVFLSRKSVGRRVFGVDIILQGAYLAESFVFEKMLGILALIGRQDIGLRQLPEREFRKATAFSLCHTREAMEQLFQSKPTAKAHQLPHGNEVSRTTEEVVDTQPPKHFLRAAVAACEMKIGLIEHLDILRRVFHLNGRLYPIAGIIVGNSRIGGNGILLGQIQNAGIAPVAVEKIHKLMEQFGTAGHDAGRRIYVNPAVR